jgi:acyl-coenzyme A synthetase/AMP-(fatty) acid ligase
VGSGIPLDISLTGAASPFMDSEAPLFLMYTSGSNRKDQRVPTAHWRLIAATNLYVASSKLDPIFQFNNAGYNYPG